MSMPLKMILAIDANEGIGDDSKFGMPWHFPGDLKNFQKVTKNHICVMGRKTYEHMKDLYDDCTLPDRHCIVITRNPEAHSFVPHTTFLELETAVETVRDVTRCGSQWKGVFVIGGAQIYKRFMEDIDWPFEEIHLTFIPKAYPCTTHLYGFFDWMNSMLKAKKLVFEGMEALDGYNLGIYKRPKS